LIIIKKIVPSLKSNLNGKLHKPVHQDAKDSDVMDMTSFAESIINDNLTEDMGTIHEAYLQIKEEFIKSNATSSKLTYINTDFKQLIGYKKNLKEICFFFIYKS